METERPHRSNSNNSSSTSELFVCFTSRLSSSSMKFSSKSLLSPSRTSRDPPPQISLSTSLSRRLRSNGSIKGGGQASPMFPATATVGGKRRGCGFENPEPSSPKVTCIGQVRVKTKKQGKKMRVTRSKSKRRTSEGSFRRTSTEGGGQITNSSDLTRQNSSSSATYMKQQHRNNQKWVHLPLTICEAFRELNCFFPCRSSCMRDKGNKGHHHHHHHHHGGGREGSSCGAAFARWLHLALQEGKEREIEVVMREEENVVEDYDHDDDDDDDVGFGGRSHRRHVFEDIDIDVVEGKKKKEEKEGEEEEEEEKGRVSICIPPKNALLLMRCRSDPVKMAALANRFWDSPVHKDQHQHQDDDDDDEDEEEEEEEDEEENNVVNDVDKQEQEVVEMEEEGEEVVMQTEEERNGISERETEAGFVNIEEHNEASSLMEKPEEVQEDVAVQESCEIESKTNAEFSEEAREDSNQLMEEEEEEVEEEEEEIEREQVEEEEENDNEDENFSCVATVETQSDLHKREESSLEEEEKQKNGESSELYSIAETLTVPQQNDEPEPKTTTISQPFTEEEQLHNVVAETPPPEVTPPTNEETELNNELGSEERGTGSNGEEREAEIEGEKEETLPECLLLMMCEPKLSMEVSKETWVCSTDFIRWLPERPAGKNSSAGRKVHAAVEARNSVEKKANGTAALPPVQPGRSSCSFPAAPGLSMAAMIEQSLAAGPKSNGGYEPFVLTRCKSEPMRTTAKLAADACFWKKPHAPPPTLGVGAPAGVGF